MTLLCAQRLPLGHQTCKHPRAQGGGVYLLLKNTLGAHLKSPTRPQACSADPPVANQVCSREHRVPVEVRKCAMPRRLCHSACQTMPDCLRTSARAIIILKILLESAPCACCVRAPQPPLGRALWACVAASSVRSVSPLIPRTITTRL